MTISRLNQDVTYLPAFRNLIINGAMQVAQRGTSSTGNTSNGYRTADRWLYVIGTQGTWTHTVENDAPTGSGFRKSAKTLCTTADASPGASDILLFVQPMEGQNLQAIRKGTADAQPLTLSFWVKSNVTGTYVAELEDSDNSRQVSASYTINSSGTWEKKTIVFPADTTGVLDNDNAASFALIFWLGGGTTWTSGTLNTTWASQVNANRAVGQTNLAAATNNYWQITGVQLEVGAVATPFEFKPYAQELRECERYYFKTFEPGDAPVQNIGNLDGALTGGPSVNDVSFVTTQKFPVTMRSQPTITTFSPNAASANWTAQSGKIPTVSVLHTGATQTSVRGLTATSVGGAHSIHLTASAEL